MQPQPVLKTASADGAIRVMDTRSCSRETQYELDGMPAMLYRACEGSPDKASLPALLERMLCGPCRPRELEDALASLVERNLVLAVDGKLLSLGVQGTCPETPDIKDFPGGSIDYGMAGKL